MKIIILTLTTTLMLTGCFGVAPQETASKVKPTDQNGVKNCKFLGDVAGHSMFYGVFSGPAQRSTQDIAAQEAEKLGATHIVYGSVSSGGGGTVTTGKAYLCK